MEFTPDGHERGIHVVSLGQEHKVVLLGGVVVLQVAQEGHWIAGWVRLRSEA